MVCYYNVVFWFKSNIYKNVHLLKNKNIVYNVKNVFVKILFKQFHICVGKI